MRSCHELQRRLAGLTLYALYAAAQARTAASGAVDSDSNSSDSESDSESDAGGRQASKSKGKGRSTSTASAKAAPKKRVAKPKASGSAPKPAKAKKAYIPQTRSGAYGLLVALYSAALDVPEEGAAGEAATESWITKARLIQLATPHADVSYVPRPVAPGAPGFGGANFNSAWNSMKTLITRGYVYRTGNPARFGLSKEGFDVAAECAETEKVDMGSAVDEEEDDEPAPAPAAKGKGKKSAKARSTSPGKTASTTTSASSAFRFIYLTDARPPLRVLDRSRAALRLSDRDYTPTYRVEFPAALRDHVFVRMCIEEVEGDEDESTLQGWAREMGANEKAPGLGDVEEDSAPAPRAAPLAKKTTSAPSTSKASAAASSKAGPSKAAAGPSKALARPKPPAAAPRRREPSSSPEPDPAPAPAPAPAEPAPRAGGLQIPFGMQPRSRVTSASRTTRSATPPAAPARTTTAGVNRAPAAHVVLSDSDSDGATPVRERERSYAQRNARRRPSLSPSRSLSPFRSDPEPEAPSSPGFEEDYVASQARFGPLSQRDRGRDREQNKEKESEYEAFELITSSPVVSQTFVVASQRRRTGAAAERGAAPARSKEKARPASPLTSDSDEDLPPLSALLNGAGAKAAKGQAQAQAQGQRGSGVAKPPVKKKARSSAEVIDLS